VFTIRPATSHDLERLPAIESAGDVLFADAGMQPPPGVSSVEELAAALLVLVAGRPPVGFARIEVVDGIVHLEQLSVHPRVSRRGIGRELVAAVCTWAAEHGSNAVTLITYRDVPWNAPYYTRLGFSELTDLSPGLRKLRAHEQEIGLDALGPRIVMRRDLSASSQPPKPGD
jgi:GNAT superfamily N-acetyltransferase